MKKWSAPVTVINSGVSDLLLELVQFGHVAVFVLHTIATGAGGANLVTIT